jgi:hypothetical protein
MSEGKLMMLTILRTLLDTAARWLARAQAWVYSAEQRAAFVAEQRRHLEQSRRRVRGQQS